VAEQVRTADDAGEDAGVVNDEQAVAF